MKDAIKASSTKLVKISDLRPSPWNPPKRSEPARIASLAKSMDAVGQLVPIIVTDDNQVIEGHRRVAAATSLEWTHLDAKVISGAVAEHIYAEVNTEVKRLSGNDALSVWLKNKSAVSGPARKTFTKIEKAIGKSRMHKMANLGLSSRVYRTAVAISAFISDPNVGHIVDWLLSYSGTGMIGQLMKAMEIGEGKTAIAKAMAANKPVKISLSA